MKKEAVNIFSDKKILYENLLNKKIFFSKFDFKLRSYSEINILKKDNDKLSIFFIPPEFKKIDCKKITDSIDKINTSFILLCLPKKFGTIFSRWNANILFLPISFNQLENKINFIKLSSKAKFDKLELNRMTNNLTNLASKKTIMLTQIEVNILGILMQSSTDVFREELNSKALGYSKEINSHSLDSHIYRLRKKLLSVSNKNKIVSNNIGKYKLI